MRSRLAGFLVDWTKKKAAAPKLRLTTPGGMVIEETGFAAFGVAPMPELSGPGAPPTTWTPPTPNRSCPEFGMSTVGSSIAGHMEVRRLASCGGRKGRATPRSHSENERRGLRTKEEDAIALPQLSPGGFSQGWSC